MPRLLETGPAAGGFVYLAPGRWRISSDIAAGNVGSVTFEEKDSSDATATARPVRDSNGDVITHTTPGASFMYESGGGFIQATQTGGNASVVVRAQDGAH